MNKVAALYVDPKGPYWDRPDVDAWDEERDARLYDGPWPVVAHPPCGHWGRFRWNCKQPDAWKWCGPRAVEQVQEFGGILEHPDGTHLWRYCRLPRPGYLPMFHQSSGILRWQTWTLQVDQVWWGHGVRKRTWLYMVGIDPRDVVLPDGRHTMRPTHAMGVSRKQGRTLPCLPKSQRHITPTSFADWLVSTAAKADKG